MHCMQETEMFPCETNHPYSSILIHMRGTMHFSWCFWLTSVESSSVENKKPSILRPVATFL